MIIKKVEGKVFEFKSVTEAGKVPDNAFLVFIGAMNEKVFFTPNKLEATKYLKKGQLVLCEKECLKKGLKNDN